MNVFLRPVERKLLRNVLSHSGEAACVALVGSVARASRSSNAADLDVLVLNGRARPPLQPGLQIIVLSLDAMNRRVLEGDDFAQWALRFGIPIRGRAKWEELKQRLLPIAPWPDHEIKRQQAVKRLETAKDLLQLGDYDAAREELLFSVSHLARARLLHHRVFPLSRPELSRQLAQIDEHELADLLHGLQVESEMGGLELEQLVAELESRTQRV